MAGTARAAALHRRSAGAGRRAARGQAYPLRPRVTTSAPSPPAWAGRAGSPRRAARLVSWATFSTCQLAGLSEPREGGGGRQRSGARWGRWEMERRCGREKTQGGKQPLEEARWGSLGGTVDGGARWSARRRSRALLGTDLGRGPPDRLGAPFRTGRSSASTPQGMAQPRAHGEAEGGTAAPASVRGGDGRVGAGWGSRSHVSAPRAAAGRLQLLGVCGEQRLLKGTGRGALVQPARPPHRPPAAGLRTPRPLRLPTVFIPSSVSHFFPCLLHPFVHFLSHFYWMCSGCIH